MSFCNLFYTFSLLLFLFWYLHIDLYCSSPFSLVWFSLEWISHNLFILSLAGGHLNCFQFHYYQEVCHTILKSMSLYKYASVSKSLSMCIFNKKLPNCSLKSLHQFIPHQESMRVPDDSHPHQTLYSQIFTLCPCDDLWNGISLLFCFVFPYY